MLALRSLADTPIVEHAVSVAERAHDLRGHCPGVGVVRTPGRAVELAAGPGLPTAGRLIPRPCYSW